jgi:hypothetical protein
MLLKHAHVDSTIFHCAMLAASWLSTKTWIESENIYNVQYAVKVL